jgi:lactate dehydrogenase-like 2-hydroxyacid dehydrogenase
LSSRGVCAWQLESCSREDVPDRIGQYDICVPKMTRLDAAVIARAKPRLQLIVQFGVGLEGREAWLC